MVLELREQFRVEQQQKVEWSATRIGDILIQNGYILNAQLYHALEYQKENGGKLGRILINLGYVKRLDLFKAMAAHFHLPFITDMVYIWENINTELMAQMMPEEIARYQFLPFRQRVGGLEVLTSEPDDPEMLEFIHKRFGPGTINQIVITDLDVMRITNALFQDRMLEKSVDGLSHRDPEESAKRVLTRPQIITMLALLAATVVFAVLNANIIFLVFLFAAQLFYLVSFLYKFTVTAWGLKQIRKNRKIQQEVKNMDPRTLPLYTVLIAAYKEDKVIPNLIKAVKKFDYPADKLDVILLLEEDDKVTLNAAKLAKPPGTWRLLTLPNSQPKTKPKALNYGVQFARGKYLTIYDAEDVPEPDQLKKAVAAFREHTDDYICFQASLNYFNRDENPLTKWFTLEYTYWFDCLLPGLDSLRLPIPLGGTSNHFDTEKLLKIGCWDPFNVTEDADLGIRAAAEGYKVGVIKSTTFEEANSRLGNWLRQRSRWVKGYMQTFLVHNRHPLKAIKIMGLKQWLGYNLLIGGTPALFLLNPVMWALFFYFLLTGAPILDPASMPAVLWYISAINLILGNLITMCLNLIAVASRKFYYLIPYALLSPVYWLLQSIGAYKALWQLITKPSYWEKTEHGITNFTLSL
jgi:glycosyltransferase XagB